MVHLHSGPSVLYPDCLLPSAPCGRTGTGPFGREPSNSTGGTFTHERNRLLGLLRCDWKWVRKKKISVNANGVSSQSPGLRGTSYPGLSFSKFVQPQRGCGDSRLRFSCVPEMDASPLGLVIYWRLTQGSACWRNPGL